MDWVVTPNVIGMGLYADGGQMSTKPYISSGQYIHKMSDYCATCTYQIKQRIGESACPFHSLYWDFIDKHQDSLRENYRMQMMVASWQKTAPLERELMKNQAENVRQRLQKCQL
jgi:deoxyribodipyrimidine photolyase-related protein